MPTRVYFDGLGWIQPQRETGEWVAIERPSGEWIARPVIGEEEDDERRLIEPLPYAASVLFFVLGTCLLHHSHELHRSAAARFDPAPGGLAPSTCIPLVLIVGGVAWFATSVLLPNVDDPFEADAVLPALLCLGIAPSVLALVQYSAASTLLRQSAAERGLPVPSAPLWLPTAAAFLSTSASILTIARNLFAS